MKWHKLVAHELRKFKGSTKYILISNPPYTPYNYEIIRTHPRPGKLILQFKYRLWIDTITSYPDTEWITRIQLFTNAHHFRIHVQEYTPPIPLTSLPEILKELSVIILINTL